MDSEKENGILQDIADFLTGLGIEITTTPGAGGYQLGRTIMALVPVTDDGKNVLMEIALARFDEERGFIQFYSTMIMEIGLGMQSLKDAIPDLNFYCTVGSFGIYNAMRQFYHKYSLVFGVDDAIDIIGSNALMVFETIHDILSTHLPLVSQLAFGELDYETAISGGSLLPQPGRTK